MMFAFKKHSPYSLRVQYTPAQLKNLLDQSTALCDQVNFMINRIQHKWREIGLLDK